MNELALFAGAGGGILGGHLLGWRTVCAVEWSAYPASVLCARQNDGILPPFPIWDDVQTFDGKPWRGIVDVVSGGFPCQDISSAGAGAGITGERSGMWKEFARIIGEVRPGYAYIENSPMLTLRGLDVVLCDLAAMGFDAEWGVVSAADTGAPHMRERIWILAHSEGIRYREGREARNLLGTHGRQDGSLRTITGGSSQQSENLADPDSLRKLQQEGSERDIGRWAGNRRCEMADSNSAQCEGNQCTKRVTTQHADIGGAGWWGAEPNVGRVADGVAARVDRLKAIGNGQVPRVAATAFNILSQ